MYDYIPVAGMDHEAWTGRCAALAATPLGAGDPRIERSYVEGTEERAVLCSHVLHALPEWFYIDEAREEFIAGSRSLPMIAMTVEGFPVGFVSVAIHFAHHADLFVLGVAPGFHRAGLGQRMISAAEAHAREQGVRYMTVKTLAASHPDPNYAKTRSFYEKLGYQPFEVLPTLWDPSYPCLMMIKDLV